MNANRPSGTGPLAAACRTQDGTVAGPGGPIPVRDYLPDAPAQRPAFLWVHGGAFMGGGIKQAESDAVARALAARGIRVRTLHYRLAPMISLLREPRLRAHGGRFPAGLDDVVAVAKDLVAITGGPIDLGGASAGANLAAATTMRLRDAGDELPRRLALAYGTFHVELPTGSPAYAGLRGPLARWAFNPRMTRRMNLNYVGDEALLVPGYAFPGGADTSGFPPTLLMDASNDRLRASGIAFAEQMRTASVEVRQVVVPAMHGFLANARSPRFREGVRHLGSWLLE